MSRRAKSADRQAEIIEATLRLLEETPLARLTTRQIAKQLDISQPALFRHFRSREQLLLAVMQKARSDLGAIADSVLVDVSRPLERLRTLAARLLGHVETYPGLARLLFSPPEKGPLRDLLRQLVSMQRSLVSELVRDGQQAGIFRADLNPTDAATFYVGMIQGVVLRSQLEDDRGRLTDEAEPMLALWLEGARCSSATPAASVQTDGPAEIAPSANLSALDVRPILAGGTDPLDHILAAVATVCGGGVLTITAPFRPMPLMRLLTERGHLVTARQLGDRLWSIDIVVGGGAAIEELLDLEPPEPLERVLEATASLAPGATYVARLPRFPRMLVPHLSERPIKFEFSESADGTALLHVRANS